MHVELIMKCAQGDARGVLLHTACARPRGAVVLVSKPTGRRILCTIIIIRGIIIRAKVENYSCVTRSLWLNKVHLYLSPDSYQEAFLVNNSDHGLGKESPCQSSSLRYSDQI